MKRMYFARKIRQLKHLRKQLEAHKRGKNLLTAQQWHELYHKAKLLLKKVAAALSAKELQRAAAVLGISILMGNPMAQAQSFAPPQTDPFGLEKLRNEGMYLFGMADWDNDGDLDIISTSEYQYPLFYMENTGSAVAPQFAAPTMLPSASFGSFITLPVDMDNDGDFDLIGMDYDSGYNQALLYAENTGTAQQPAFGSTVLNPFGIQMSVNTKYNFPTVADLDDDGDMDLLVFAADYNTYQVTSLYWENTGNATTPQFGVAQTGVFSIAIPQDRYINLPTTVDLDGDGDLDLLVGSTAYDDVTEEYTCNLFFYENTGTVNTPSFAAPVQDLFGLELPDENIAFAIPSAADLDGDGDMDIVVQTYTDGAYYEVQVLYFENTGSSGFQKIEMVDVQVFPNPTADWVQIKSEEAPQAVQLFDAKGQLVLEENSPTQTISLAGLPTGQYSLRCRFEEGKMGVIRVVKE